MCLITFQINGYTYSIRLTEHAEERRKQRNVSKMGILNSVTSLTFEQLEELKEEDKDVAIINKDKGHTVIITREGNKIKVITVIAKDDVWVKERTDVVSIN